MDEDKTIPFTEFDYKEMEEMKKQIFTPEFIKIVDSTKNKLSDDQREIKIKIQDFLLDLMDKEDDKTKKILMYKPILYGLYESLISSYWGINKIMEYINDFENDKVK